MKFCASCGAQVRPPGRVCVSCGTAIAQVLSPPAAALPAPTAVPGPPPELPPELPPLLPARYQSNVGAFVVGLFAIALVAGGITFLVMQDDGTVTSPSATNGAQSTLATVAPSNLAPTSAAVLTPAAQLAATVDADRPLVESLVGQWEPQLSAKRDGLVADGITYTPADIVALQAKFVAQFGAVLLWSGDYVFEEGDLWISIAPKPFSTADEALAWCVAAGLDRDNCLATLITHDASIVDTAKLQT